MEADRLIGTEVAGYRIESVLGRGAMGIVYVALQRAPERRVALKLIAPAYADDDTFRRRFLREATAAAAIEHPHILPVYAAGEEDGTLYLAMRLAGGSDLREILHGSDGLPIERATAIVEQIGSALDTAHARGLVHRDVKPGNILVTRPPGEDLEFCYLTDFGISQWATSTASTITATGRMVGTANYVAPEQIEGGRVEGPADVYSLGCVLYECLTGSPPFGGRSAVATLYGHLHEEATPPSEHRTDLPAGVDAVVARALRKAPEERYASCRALTRDVRAAVSGAPTSASTMPAAPTNAMDAAPDLARPTRARGRRSAAVAAVVTIALVAVAAAVIATMGDDPLPAPSPTPPAENLIRDGVQATASSTAPSSTDGAGDPVSYLPGNVVDGDVETAWRTPGDGLGEQVTLLFDTPVDLERIGVIPGYAKTDPETGVDRFFQNRIITDVTYLIPGLPPKTQTFQPEPVPQYVHLNVTTSRVTLVIEGTTEPGGLDYTAISEIYVYGTRP